MMDELRLSGLVASRICHDLISPVGAIGNGVELMRAVGDRGEGGAEEMELIADCAGAASAALRFLRLAFGARDAEESIPLAELRAAAEPHLARRGIRLDWGDAPQMLRLGAARPLLLLALAGAGALPRGGAMRLGALEEAPLRLEWRLEAERVRPGERLRALLSAPPDAAGTGAGEAHVLLLWLLAAEAGARPYWREEGAIGVA
ncbi:MAG: histidine phosphotransferase family protein [Pikeienuella sp.]